MRELDVIRAEALEYAIGNIVSKLNDLDPDRRVAKELMWREWLRRVLRRRGDMDRVESLLIRSVGESDVFRYVVLLALGFRVFSRSVAFEVVGSVSLFFVPRRCLLRPVDVPGASVKFSVGVEKVSGRYVVVVEGDEGVFSDLARVLLEALRNYEVVNDVCVERIFEGTYPLIRREE